MHAAKSPVECRANPKDPTANLPFTPLLSAEPRADSPPGCLYFHSLSRYSQLAIAGCMNKQQLRRVSKQLQRWKASLSLHCQPYQSFLSVLGPVTTSCRASSVSHYSLPLAPLLSAVAVIQQLVQSSILNTNKPSEHVHVCVWLLCCNHSLAYYQTRVCYLVRRYVSRSVVALNNSVLSTAAVAARLRTGTATGLGRRRCPAG